MADDFKPGDTVMLKSGGPRMTYERKAQEGYGVCVWFEDNKNYSKPFAHAVLKKDGDAPLPGYTPRAVL